MAPYVVMFLLIFIGVRVEYTHAIKNLAVLEASSSGSTYSTCVPYNSFEQRIPTYYQSTIAPKHELLDYSHNFVCKIEEHAEMDNKVVAVKRGNCTFAEKAVAVSHNGAALLLAVSDSNIVVPGGNRSMYFDINITIAIIDRSEFINIQAMKSPIYIKLFQTPGFDPSAIILLVIALFTISVGALWSGCHISCPQVQSDMGDVPTEAIDTNNKSAKPVFTFTVVAVMITAITTFLLLTYYFYDYMVYFIIAMFCLGGSFAMYFCISPLYSRLPFQHKLKVLRYDIQIKNILLAILCVSIAVVWAVFRNRSFAWILQDIIGVSFCIFIIKKIQLPNFKFCTALLCCLFIYDVFFVFITPYITKSGKSIMVEVATGGSGTSNERIPLLLAIPKILACHDSLSLLGFGDIMTPGLALSYAYRLDRSLAFRKLIPVYFTLVLLGYIAGLLFTGIALFLMERGQPALLYIVPCILFAAIVPALIKKEFRILWTGKLNICENDNSSRTNGLHDRDKLTATYTNHSSQEDNDLFD